MAVCLATLILSATLAACGDDEPTPAPLRQDQRAATLVPLPTNTPLPTDTPEPTGTPDPDAVSENGDVPFGLPADLSEPIIQFARIEPGPWEPEILAQMHPNFSLQGNGYAVYRYDGGSSIDGWYQTIVTPTLALDLLQHLVEEIDVADLAETLDQPELRFEMGLDGKPVGMGAIGIIYVNSSQGSTKLVISEEDLEQPKGDTAGRVKQLHDVIRALQYWRNATEEVADPGVKAAVLLTLGWWQDKSAPYTPETVVGFGTGARSYYPDDATIVDWPLLETPLSTLIESEYGGEPTEIRLDGADAVLVQRQARERGLSFWGPLWQDVDGGDRYLLGLRPAIPGSNHTVVDYEYVLTKRGVQPPAEEE
jgi:hypothetical protein